MHMGIRDNAPARMQLRNARATTAAVTSAVSHGGIISNCNLPTCCCFAIEVEEEGVQYTVSFQRGSSAGAAAPTTNI